MEAYTSSEARAYLISCIQKNWVKAKKKGEGVPCWQVVVPGQQNKEAKKKEAWGPEKESALSFPLPWPKVEDTI